MAASPSLVKNIPPIRNEGRALAFNAMPKWLDSLNYGVAGAKSYTVPAGMTMLRLSASMDSYIQTNGGTAAIPSGDVTNGSSVTKLVAASAGLYWAVNPGDVLSIYGSAAGNVFVEGWA